MDGGEDVAQIVGGKEIGKRVEKFCKGSVGSGWNGEVADTHFALARRKRIGVNDTKREGRDVIETHSKGFTLRSESDACKPETQLSGGLL
jgi:hypothetical protein